MKVLNYKNGRYEIKAKVPNFGYRQFTSLLMDIETLDRGKQIEILDENKLVLDIVFMNENNYKEDDKFIHIMHNESNDFDTIIDKNSISLIELFDDNF